MKKISTAISIILLAVVCFWLGGYYALSKLDSKRMLIKSESEIASSIYHLIIYSKLLSFVDEGAKKNAEDIVYREMDRHVYELNLVETAAADLISSFKQHDLETVCARLDKKAEIEKVFFCD